MALTVSFFGKDRGLSAHNKKTAEEAAKIDNAYKQVDQTTRRYNAEARRAMREQRTDAERYRETLKGLKQQVDAGNISRERAVLIARRMKDQLRGVGSIQTRITTRAAAMLGSYLGVHSAIQMATQALQAHHEMQKRLSREGRSYQEAAAGFMAQQQGDPVAAATRFARVAARYGQLETAEEAKAIFDAAERVQSAVGDKRFLPAMANLAIASRLGVRIEDAASLIVRGQAMGVASGPMLAGTVRAGQIMSNPQDVAANSGAIKYYERVAQGMAWVAFQASLEPERARVLATQMARGAEGSLDLKRLSRDAGVKLTAETPLGERIEALYSVVGEQLSNLEAERYGLSEQRQKDAIGNALQSVAQVRAAEAEITQAMQGTQWLRGEAARQEAADTTGRIRAQRENEILRSSNFMRTQELFSDAAMANERYRLERGGQRIEIGRMTGPAGPLVDEDLEATEGFWSRLSGIFEPGGMADPQRQLLREGNLANPMPVSVVDAPVVPADPPPAAN